MSSRIWFNRALLVLSVVLFFVLLIWLTGEVADAVIAALLAIVGLVIFLFEPVRKFVESDEFGSVWVSMVLSSVVLLFGSWLGFSLLQDLATTGAPLSTSTLDELATQVADAIYAVKTQTATMWTPTLTADVSATVEAHLTETALAVSATPTTTTMSSTVTPSSLLPSATSSATSTSTATPPLSSTISIFIPTNVEPNWTPVVEEVHGISFTYVPAGCFMMGSTEEQLDAVLEMCVADLGTGECDRGWFENEQPTHEVCLSAFWISQTEVTNDQFRACVDAGECESPINQTYFSEYYPRRPVVWIDWYRAEAYAQWVGGSLPTEAQWEYAARGPAGYVYPWGDEDPTCELADTYGCKFSLPQVGSYEDGASWVGALDMAGSVWEWVADWYSEDYYVTLASGTLDPAGPGSGTSRVLRGGSFANFQWYARATLRHKDDPDDSDHRRGFRVVIPTLP
jgi:formylglycine-generating enzyme required for sulfatase activity